MIMTASRVDVSDLGELAQKVALNFIVGEFDLDRRLLLSIVL